MSGGVADAMADTIGRPERGFRPPVAALRPAIVGLIAMLALVTSLPNLIYFVLPIYGGYGFVTDYEHRVAFVNPDATRAGLRVGDRVDYAATPSGARYVIPNFRLPPVGERTTFRFVRDGVARDVTLHASQPSTAWGRDGVLGEYLLKRAASLVLILAAVALVLIRPTGLTSAFFLYAVGSTHANPLFWSFLPVPGFFAVQAVYELLNAAGTTAFLLLALRLRCDPAPGWRAVLDCAAPAIFAVSVLIALAGNVEGELVLGPAGALLLNAEDVLAACILTVAIAVLLDTSRCGGRGVPHAMRWTALGLALAGAGDVLALVVNSSWSVWSLPPVVYESGWVFSIVVSLVTAYLIVRYRIVDVRSVAVRSVAYGMLATSTVAAFAAVNLAFAKQWAQTAFVIPLEIVIAVLLGYRLSGLADVATALSMADADATAAILHGRRAEQREIFAKALGRAERTRRRGIIAEVRARAAFGAWVAGEDAECERATDALARLIGSSRARGLGVFLRAVRGDADLAAPAASDLHEWVACAHLMACANADDARVAAEHAFGAIAAADASGTPYLGILARVAAAEFDPASRDGLYAAAAVSARAIGSASLEEALRGLQRNETPAAIEPLVTRLRKPRAANPLLEVNFLTASVRSMGADVKLRDAEKALLFGIAHRASPVPAATLIDALWPDSDGDAAQNAFRVCLHRVRRALGDPHSIQRVGRSYQLKTGAVIDLRSLPELARSANPAAPLTQNDRATLLDGYARIGATRAQRAGAGAWFDPYAVELRLREHNYRLRLAYDALSRRDLELAITLSATMLTDEPHDEDTRTLVDRVRLAGGDRQLPVP